MVLCYALASIWMMHNTRMEKQINLINTFKMTMIFPIFIFKSYLTVKKTFLGDLDLVQNKSLPTRFLHRDAKTLQNEVLYDSLWLLFVKFWNSHFLMAAILAAILNLLTRKFLRWWSKLYLICQNLALCQILNLYQSGIHKLKMTILSFFCYISMSYSTLKMTFSGDLNLES